MERDTVTRSEDAPAPVRVGLGTIFLAFLRLGMTAFGGPAMVAYIKELAVARKGWLDEKSFRNGVSLCQTIPGATAMQAAAYVGLRARGIPGGLAAYVGFGLPAFLLMVGLSALYGHVRELPATLSLFHGLRVVVVAIVANAAVNFARSSVKNPRDGAVAVLAAAALAGDLLDVKIHPIAVILSAGALGYLILSDDAKAGSGGPAPSGAKLGAASLTALVALFAMALGALFAIARPLFDFALTMVRIDLFAFGGGFGSVPLMQHEVVVARGWMDARTFMDGIALGQVTPGPIVITATFVGYLLWGLAGAVIGTVAIFSPSFLLLSLTLPVFDRLQGAPAFRKAMRGALLAFVGLLAATTIRFGIAVDWTVPAALLGIAAFVALRYKVDIIWVVVGGGILSMLIL